jgi:hypothetical protein
MNEAFARASRFDYRRRLGYIIRLTLLYQSGSLAYRNEIGFNFN